MTYLTVAEGTMVKLDNASNLHKNEETSDWVLYTALSGVGGPQGSGIMKCVSAIEVNWVRHLVPLLEENKVDVKKLS